MKSFFRKLHPLSLLSSHSRGSVPSNLKALQSRVPSLVKISYLDLEEKYNFFLKCTKIRMNRWTK